LSGGVPLGLFSRIAITLISSTQAQAY